MTLPTLTLCLLLQSGVSIFQKLSSVPSSSHLILNRLPPPLSFSPADVDAVSPLSSPLLRRAVKGALWLSAALWSSASLPLLTLAPGEECRRSRGSSPRCHAVAHRRICPACFLTGLSVSLSAPEPVSLLLHRLSSVVLHRCILLRSHEGAPCCRVYVLSVSPVLLQARNRN